MPKKELLSDRSVARLPKPEPGEHYLCFDTRCTGFCCKVSRGLKTGRVKKTLMLRARFPGSVRPEKRLASSGQRINPVFREIGAFGQMGVDKAREIAEDWLLVIRRGQDPKVMIEAERRESKLRRDATFERVVERWLKEHASMKRRAKRMERDVRLLVLPPLKDRPIADIARGEIRGLIQLIKTEHGPWQARSALSHIKSIINFAINTESYGLEVSPADRLTVQNLISKLGPRHRTCDDAELRAIMLAIEKLPTALWRDFFKVLMLTGQRRSEIANLKKSEIDFSRKLLTIAPERFKTETPHVLPLTDTVLDILARRSEDYDGYLFSYDGGKNPIRDFARAVKRLNIEATGILGKKSDTPWTLHDWRRSYRTRLSELKVRTEAAEAAIGHSKTGMLAVYDKYQFLPEIKDAMLKWQRLLEHLVERKPTEKVVELRGKR